MLPNRPGLAIALMLLALVLGAGCGDNSDGLSKEQRSTSDRFVQIMDRTKGDWNQLTDEDRAFVLSLANGNESAARTMFEMRANRRPPTGTPSGGPGGG